MRLQVKPSPTVSGPATAAAGLRVVLDGGRTVLNVEGTFGESRAGFAVEPTDEGVDQA
jgi:hypothetical protein